MVSIIVLTYNRAAFLFKSLGSILNQTYKEFEVIIVDDGSIDNTFEVVKSMNDTRIRFINMGKIGNISILRNIGVREACGEIIAFCDDDDIWMKKKLEIQLNYLITDKIVCSNGNVINDKDEIIYKEVNHFNGDRYIDLCQLLVDNRILTSSILLCKSIFDEIGFFDESDYRSEDYDLWIRIAKKYKLKYIDQILISYRIHSNNMTIKTILSKEGYQLRNCELIKPFLICDDSKIVEAAKSGLTMIYGKLAKFSFMKGDILSSCEFSKKFLLINNKKLSFKFLKYFIFYIFVNILRFLKLKNVYDSIALKFFNEI